MVVAVIGVLAGVAAAQGAGATLFADAGADLVIEAGKTVRLDGTRSVGAESFTWRFVTGPAIVEAMPSFEAPSDRGDEYGTRMRGWLHPPVSGKYRFWIASDDNGELWLGRDATPGEKRLIAGVEGWTRGREWDKYPKQRSKRVRLKAGSAYYIEALHKEGGGWDGLAVAWEGPGRVRQVIPGEFLSETENGRAGAVTREVWTGLPGGAVAHLTGSPAFTGEPVSLAAADGPRPAFAPARAGTYEFELEVSDGGKTVSDRVRIKVIEDARPKRIVVDPKRAQGKVNPRALGINLNYLVDDDANREKPVQTLNEALRELGVTILRFPGGDKSDSHLWSRPPFEKAAPAPAVAGDWDWPATDRRLFMPDRKTWRIDPLDFDEYMALVRDLGVEATVVVPVDAGFQEAGKHNETIEMDELIRTAVEWVKYAGRNRFPVRYWEIGNESYFHVSAARYARTLVRFARAMREVDPEIRIGAVGMYGESVGRKEEGEVPWNRDVLEEAGKLIDYVIVHDYPNYGWRSYEGYLDRDPDFTDGIRRTRAAIDRWAPQGDASRIGVVLTEYGGIDYAKPAWENYADLGHALLIANMIGQYLGEPALDAALMWNTRWVDNSWKNLSVHDALAPDSSLTAVGRALAIWSRFRGSEMLEVADGRLLKVFATRKGGAVNVLLINKGMSEHECVLEMKGGGEASGSRWLFSGKTPDDRSPEFRKVGAVALESGTASLVLPPVSLTVLEFQAP